MRMMIVALAGTVLAPAAAIPAPAALILTGNGVKSGTATVTFDKASRAQAIALVTAVLGKPEKTGNHGDCGQGAEIAFAAFHGGFELSFVKGRLSGWTADAPGLRTAKGVAVGSTIAALKTAYPDIDVDPGDEANGGGGPNFQRGGGPNG